MQSGQPIFGQGLEVDHSFFHFGPSQLIIQNCLPCYVVRCMSRYIPDINFIGNS
jgi:hypothetical protein